MLIQSRVPSVRSDEQSRGGIADLTHTIRLPERIDPATARASFTLTSTLLIIVRCAAHSESTQMRRVAHPKPRPEA